MPGKNPSMTSGVLHRDQWAWAMPREAEWVSPRRRNAATISIPRRSAARSSDIYVDNRRSWTTTNLCNLAERYPAVIWRRLLLVPPMRPVRRVGAGMLTGAERVGMSVELLRRRASSGHMCTAC